MKALLCSLCLLAFGVSTGCVGDYRTLYTGNYAATETLSFTSSTGTVTNTFSPGLTVTRDLDRTRIDLDDGICPMTAVIEGDAFTLDPVVCPSQTSTNIQNGSSCTYTINSNGGSGTRTGDNLSFDLSGSAPVTCTDGSSATEGISQHTEALWQ